MKVKELIELLKKEDPEKVVQVKGWCNGTFGPVGEVREGRHARTKGCVCITP
jgi:hypothetical protein